MDNMSLDEIRQLIALDECLEKKTSGNFVKTPSTSSCEETIAECDTNEAELIQTKKLFDNLEVQVENTQTCEEKTKETDNDLLELYSSIETLQTEFIRMRKCGEYKGCLDKTEVKDPEVQKQLDILEELFNEK